MIDLFSDGIAKLKETISFKNRATKDDDGSRKDRQKWDKKLERFIIDMIRQLEIAIQLFMYITEEGKISSDIGKIENILR